MFRPTGDPDVWEWRLSRVPFVFAAVIAFVMSAGLLLAALGYGQPPLLPALLFSLFTGVVSWSAFAYKVEVRIDRHQRTVTRVRRTVAGKTIASWGFDDIEHVTIWREVQSQGESNTTVYPVGFSTHAGEREKLQTKGDYLRARSDARQIANFLEKPIADSGLGEESIIAREVPTGRAPAAKVPDPPADLRSAISRERGMVVIDVPPAGQRAPLIVMQIAGLLFAAGGAWFVLRPATSPLGKAPSVILILFFSVSLSLLFFCVGLHKARRRERVELSHDGLRLTTKGPFFSSDKLMPSEEIEEVRVHETQAHESASGKNPVTVIGTQRLLRFGGHLPLEESQFLRAFVEGVLANYRGR